MKSRNHKEHTETEIIEAHDFEVLVGNLIGGLAYHQHSAGLQIHHRRRYRGRRSGHEHEIDLSFTVDVAGAEVVVVVECKAYRRPVAVEDVLTFAERIDDIGAHKGILVTLRSFQPGALRVAAGRGIALVLARPHERRLEYVQRWMPDPEEARHQRRTIESMGLSLGLPPQPLGDECSRIWHQTLGFFSTYRDSQSPAPEVPPLDFIVADQSWPMDPLQFGALLAGVCVVTSKVQGAIQCRDT